VQDAGFRVQGSGFKIEGLGPARHVLGEEHRRGAVGREGGHGAVAGGGTPPRVSLRVQGLRFRVEGSGLRIEGSGSRV